MFLMVSHQKSGSGRTGLSPTIALATEAELPILLGCQLGTVARNHATGNKRNPGACKRALQTVMWTDAPVACAFFTKTDHAAIGRSWAQSPRDTYLSWIFVPSGGRGRASRPE